MTLASMRTAAAIPTAWLHALFDVAAFVLLHRRIPQLPGRSPEQIESRLTHGVFRPADVAGTR